MIAVIDFSKRSVPDFKQISSLSGVHPAPKVGGGLAAQDILLCR